MNIERYYLLKVLGLSTIPRIVTFVLTLVSFPLMVRALGAREYGIYVYLISVMAILESFSDFGVSSAAGKAIAKSRSTSPLYIRSEFLHWVKAQGAVALIGLLPLVMVGYYMSVTTDTFTVPFEVFVVVTLSVWLAIANSFIRACLVSLLAFKYLAVLDTVESVARSSGWLFVAFAMPMLLVLALAGLVTVVCTSVLGVLLVMHSLRKYPTSTHEERSDLQDIPWYRRRELILDSLRFLGLRVATRCFQSFPIMLLGRMYGAELIGVIGAFSQLSDMVSFPISVLGNGLKVRAQEIKHQGIDAIRRFFDLAFRLTMVSMALACGMFLVSKPVAMLYVRDSLLGPVIFSIMSILIFARSGSDLFAPAIDYVGGLGLRVGFLSLCAVLQVPLIWAGGHFYAESGAVTILVTAYCGMVVGYILIAKLTFLGNVMYRVPRDVYVASAVIVGVMIGTVLVYAHIISVPLNFFGIGGELLLILGIYGLGLAVIFWFVPVLRENYLTLRFLSFSM
jgi:O-antigen/teichoic acid export membrane protein